MHQCILQVIISILCLILCCSQYNLASLQALLLLTVHWFYKLIDDHFNRPESVTQTCSQCLCDNAYCLVGVHRKLMAFVNFATSHYYTDHNNKHGKTAYHVCQ